MNDDPLLVQSPQHFFRPIRCPFPARVASSFSGCATPHFVSTGLCGFGRSKWTLSFVVSNVLFGSVNLLLNSFAQINS